MNAIEHDGDRIHVKEQECIGCRLCAIACPFGAIHPDARLSPVSQACATRRLSYPSPLSSLLTWAPGQYTCAVKCDLCAFDPDGPHCVAACPTKALTVMGGAADRELDEAKRLRSIEDGPVVDVTAVAQACPRKQKGA